MAATRTVLLKTGLVDDLALVSLIVTLAGVAGPVLLYLAVRKTPLSFLFIRPQWARLPATLRKSELVSSQPGRLEA